MTAKGTHHSLEPLASPTAQPSSHLARWSEPCDEARCSEDDDESFQALLRAAAHLSDPSTDRTNARLALGGTLAGGRLQLLRRLGRGGMGVVFEAFDAERRSKVALKLLTGLRPDRVYRLKNEFRTLLALRHPNLLRLHELFADEGLWYYTMELVHGVPFDRFVRPAGEPDPRRLRTCFAQLCEAVLAIHQAGKVHRDLKPSNVLVTTEGKVVVLDFGLSVDAAVGGVGQTVSEQLICGTPAYMAPEQAAGKAPLPTSDVYALGVMLFEALSGRLPFDGSAGEMIAAKQRDQAPSLTPTDDTLRELTDLCQTLLARDPAARPSVRELAACVAQPRGSDSRAHAKREVHAASYALYGRETELALLARSFDESARGEAVLVSISGESGLGKSALCAAFLERVRAHHDVTVLAGRCYERESVPFKAFDPLIDALTRQLRKLSREQVETLLPPDAAALTRLFPVLERVSAFAQAPALAPCSPESVQQRAFAAFGALLSQLCARGPLIVLMDDLQWADADSLAFLQQLVTGPPVAALFIASHRRGVRNQALTRVLALARENRRLSTRALELGPLAPASTAALVSALAPELAHRPTTRQAIVSASEGNPFFARTLAQFARHGDVSDTGLPAALRAHLAGVSPGARRLLSLLAMAGQPLLARAALEAAEASHDDLEQLMHEHLASMGASPHAHGSGKTIECYHDRIRETVVAALDASERAHHARRLSDTLATLDDASAELQRRCLLHAGERALAHELTVRAAEQASAALAFDRAAELYGELLATPELTYDSRLALIEKCAQALVSAGRGGEAGRLYRSAAGMTTGARSLTFLRSAATQLLTAGNYTEGAPLLERVCDQAGVFFPRSTLRSVAQLVWSETRLRGRGLRFRKSDSQAGVLQLDAAHTLSVSLLNYGPLHAAAACSNYLRLALEFGHPRHISLALGLNAIFHSHTPSHAPRVGRLIARLIELCAGEQAPSMRGFVRFVQGAVAHNSLVHVEAREHLAAALEHYRADPQLHSPVDICRTYMQTNHHALGDFVALARDTPSAIDDAFRRGRLYLGVMLTGPASLPAWLLHDDALAVRHRIDDARQRWVRPMRPQLPDFILLTSEAALALYTGEPERGLDLLRTQAPAYAASVGHLFKRRLEPMVALWEGFCAAAALRSRERRELPRSVLRQQIEQTILKLARQPFGFHSAVLAFRSVLALERGDIDAAVSFLQQPALPRDLGTRGLCATARRLRLGQLIRGETGKLMVAQSRAELRALGVVNIEAMTEYVFPGLRA